MQLLREVDFSNCPSSLEIPRQCFKGCTKLQRCIFPGAKEIEEDKDLLFVDHIDGNGAYVDTGYVPTRNTRLEFTFMQNLTRAAFASDDVWIGVMPHAGDTSAFKFHAYIYDDTINHYYSTIFYWARDNKGEHHSFESEDYSTEVSLYNWDLDGQTRNVWLDVKCYGTTMEIEGEKITSSNPYSDPPKRSITIFGGKLQFGGKLRTYDFSLKALRILEDDVVKMDLKPAIDSNKVACFYDMVSKKTLYSANGKQMKGVLA